MKIPENMENTSQFNRLRQLKQDASESITMLKYNVYSALDNPKKTKRNLTRQEMDEINSRILKDNENNHISSVNSKLPLVSVIIRYNKKEYLVNLLNSFSSVFSTYPNYEILIINNTSELKLNEEYDKPVNIITDLKKHSVSLYNQAVIQAKGDYLLFLDDDVKPLDGFLNHMMDTMLNHENVGVVGSRLIYPELKNNKRNSYTIEHEGFVFNEVNNVIEPCNKNEFEEYYTSCDEPNKIIATSLACLLIKKSVFESVNGFDLKYKECFADIDLGLQLYRKGYSNYYNPKAMLYHFGINSHDIEFFTKDQAVFRKKWNSYLVNKLMHDKLNANCVFSQTPLTIAFVVTQDDENTTAGDYFTARTLATYLEEFGWNIKFLSRYRSKNQKSWYYLDDDIDVVVSLLDVYNIRKIHTKKKSLIKIAWLRNWFERWVGMSYFDEYDIVLASSKKACDYIKKLTEKNAHLYPLATDPKMFNNKIHANKEYECDCCFTGSYWKANREIINCIDVDSSEYHFNLYGSNWDEIPKLSKCSKGFINYKNMPEVYASTKIVLDDANHVTKNFGSVNSRVFDAFASGKLVITNCSLGNEELFGDLIPEYHSKEDLKEKLEYYMSHEDKKEELVHKIQEIILNHHTYKHRAIKLKRLLEYYTDRYN